MNYELLILSVTPTIKKYLAKQLVNFDIEDSYDLEIIIDRSIERAALDTKEELHHITDIQYMISILRKHSMTYIIGVLAQTKILQEIQNNIKTYGSIFVIGAGVSFESEMPLTSTLDILLNFCQCKNYDELEKDNNLCFKFKNEFKVICDSKEPGRSHKIIAKSFPKYIREIICLNWDNLIERAVLPLKLPKINKETTKINGNNFLWKFHGDVEEITKTNIKGKGGWIFPNSYGYLHNTFKRYMKNRLNHPFIIVIVGYSELDKTISDNIISLLENSPPRLTYRIVVDLKFLNKEKYVVGPSSFILPRIFNTVNQ